MLWSIARSSLLVTDILLALGLTLWGAWIRSSNLLLIPRFTDEAEEVAFAIRIAQGGFFPAVSIDTYNGPLFHYLLALGIALGGGPAWPRVLALIFGALTVGLTYFLGVSLALHYHPAPLRARVAGLLAAALMAVSFVPVVVNSHLAWSNATTPFWTTLFLILVSEAHRRCRPRLLVLAAAVGGLALQTHPSVTAILAGAAVWLALSRPTWLHRRWLIACAAALLLTTANLTLYNLVTGGDSVALAANQRTYAFTGGAPPRDYLGNAERFLRLSYQLVGSTLLSTLDRPERLGAMSSPPVIAYALTVLVALAFTARRAGLPLACWLAALLILPVFNRSFATHIAARYLTPLLPLSFAAVGILVSAALAGSWPTTPAPVRRTGPTWLVRLAALALAALLLSYPLARLQTFYATELRQGDTNARLWQLVDSLSELAHGGDTVVLDPSLRAVRLDGGGNAYDSLEMLLDLARVPYLRNHGRDFRALPNGAYIVAADWLIPALDHRVNLHSAESPSWRIFSRPDTYSLYLLHPALLALELDLDDSE